MGLSLPSFGCHFGAPWLMVAKGMDLAFAQAISSVLQGRPRGYDPNQAQICFGMSLQVRSTAKTGAKPRVDRSDTNDAGKPGAHSGMEKEELEVPDLALKLPVAGE